jgi:hypothetical protein
MANVTIGSRQASRLPRVCMKCGERARTEKVKTFSWYPPWVNALILVGVLPAAIVAMILTRRLTVHIPLCEAHQNHWSWRAWFTTLTAIAVGAIGFGGIIALSSQNPHGPANPLGGILCFGSAMIGLVWLIAVAIIYQLAIHPTEITERSITLANVGPEFIDALDEEEEEEEEYRRRKRRRRAAARDEDEDDEDDEDRPPRRRKSEDIEDRDAREDDEEDEDRPPRRRKSEDIEDRDTRRRGRASED